MARAWVGTSGFNYKHWRGDIYPEGLPEKRWFEHYVQHFDTVELNVTFYRLPKRESFASWARTAPPAFAFVVKGSRYVSHVKRLDVEPRSLGMLFERAAPLGDRLACVLWQLPPRWKANVPRLRGFLRLIAEHGAAQGTRHAFEFRDRSWFTEEVYAVLDEAGAALCIADAPLQAVPPRRRARALVRERVRVPEPKGWAYLRRHGTTGRYAGNYPEAMLRADAAWVHDWVEEGKDVFVFFNNDVGGHAWRNARRLAELAGAAPAAREGGEARVLRRPPARRAAARDGRRSCRGPDAPGPTALCDRARGRMPATAARPAGNPRAPARRATPRGRRTRRPAAGPGRAGG